MTSSVRLYEPARRVCREAYWAERGARQARLRRHTGRRFRILMANNPQFYDVTVIAAVNAACVLLNSGFIKIYTGSQPALDGSVTGTLLATLTFSSTAFATATASGGTVTATANSITSGTAGNTGTAGYFALVESGGSTVVATGSVGTSGADMNLNSLSISSGATVSCSSFTITEAQT
jgi:hypothetical protein